MMKKYSVAICGLWQVLIRLPAPRIDRGIKRIRLWLDMSGFELNKIAAAILLAGVVAMLTATVSGWIYGTGHHGEEKRGYQVEGVVADAGAVKKKEEPVDIFALLAEAEAAAGQKVAKKCAACHGFDKGGPNKVGPNLYGIVGQEFASIDGFNYSKALSGMEGTWDYEALYAFLRNPKKYVKGTKMAFAGLRKPKDIADMIAYMRQQHDNPPSLP